MPVIRDTPTNTAQNLAIPDLWSDELSEHVSEQTVALLDFLTSPPSDLAESACTLLDITRQLTEQVVALPAAASEKAAALLRAVAAQAESEPQAPAERSDEKVKLSSPFIAAVGPQEILTTLGELNSQVLARPQVMLEETARYLQEMSQVMSGKSAIAPAKGDRRFMDSAWTNNPLHRLSLHSYLTWSTAVERVIDRIGAPPDATERFRYVTSLFTDAMSPDNSLLGNPVALRAVMESAGGNLLDGMRNMLKDLSSKGSGPAQVDKSAFTVGENLAATPGAVVFRNEVLELIQYAPTTTKVHAIPLMLIPAVVNKFYVLDMSPGRSFVEYLVAQGFQPFMISWRNPQPEHRHWGLNTYVSAMLDAIDVIRDITGSPKVNIFTICTGAVPMAALLGYMAAKGIDKINSLTTVVSILDSNEGRSLGLFATTKAIAEAKRRSEAKGVLTGEEMAKVFTWMRPRDLVWNYWVNNYLLGKRPPALDVLYWNNDSTRLSARMHAQLLDIYSKDLLAKPGGIGVLETPIDLAKVTCDSYVVGGITDHISVWKGVYKSARIFGGKFEFVLHSSGHIQSVLTPPGTPKTMHFVNPETPASPDDWLAKAETQLDSWWSHWRDWLAQRSGGEHAAPAVLGSKRYKPGIKAPGSYVLEA